MTQIGNSTQPELNHRQIKAYDLFIAVVAVISLVLMVWQLFLPPDTEVRKLLILFDYAFCLLFFTDYIRHIFISTEKWKYVFTWGLFDLASSIPLFGPLRLFRLASLFRVLRIVRSIRILSQVLIRDRLASTVSLLMLIGTIIIVGSCFGVLHYEMQSPKANIQSAEDVAWWAIVTTSTVGYGDLYPVTSEGRVLSVLIMCVGIGLFATFAGALAGMFVHVPKSKIAPHTSFERFDELQRENQKILEQLTELNERLNRLPDPGQESASDTG